MPKPADPESAKRKQQIREADVQLLAQLGYRQEFRREFKPLVVRLSHTRADNSSQTHPGLQVFGIAFSIIGLTPSIASVLFYSLPNGGGPAMIWGVSIPNSVPIVEVETESKFMG